MRLFRSMRWLLLLAILVPLLPASAHAGVFISVGFAPPPLLVYQQPPCPEPGWMWVPGYWAYGDDGYYWVPGTWVPAPYEGALWTPGYWGWNAGMYMWHPGFWGPHVGYYGGINYGFGYFGIGFVGGEWHGREFAYNTAVMRVNTTVIRNTYINRTVIEHNTIVNDRHVAYNGGPNGIQHQPTPQERMAEHEQHMGRTSLQTQHVNAAMHDRAEYYNNNHGRPPVVAQERPRGFNGGNAPMNGRQAQPQNRGGQMQQGVRNQGQPQYQQRGPEQRPQPQYQPRPQEQRPQPQYQQRAPEQRPQPQARPEPRPQQQRPEPRNEWRDRGR